MPVMSFYYLYILVSIQPPSEPLVFTYGSTAKFQCALQSTVMIVQRIDLVVIIDSMRYRGVNSIPEKFGKGMTKNIAIIWSIDIILYRCLLYF